MNLWLRLLYTMLSWRFRSKAAYLDEVSRPFRVWPNDLDPYLHMNNGRYLTLMDLGRIDSLYRSGLNKVLSQNNWYPVVASQTIRYQKSLKLFQRFYISTKTIGWDERFLYMQQAFKAHNQVYAIALIKVRVLKKSGGGVQPSSVCEAAGIQPSDQLLADWIKAWTKSEEHMLENYNQ